MLKDLFDRREAAQTEYDAFIAPIAAEDRALTEDEATMRLEIRGRIEALDSRIEEVTADEARKAEVAEARKAALGPAEEEVRTAAGDGVKSEPRTYGDGSDHSFYADLIRSSSNSWAGHNEALERLNRHGLEVEAEVRAKSPEGRRAARQIRETFRTETGVTSRQALDGIELRTGMDTTAGSGGSFVTPEYFVQDYAPWRQAGRVFADQAHKNDLPPYGMTVFLPALSGPAGVGTQGSQNTGVTETDPTAGYLSSNLTTLAGQVIISQQLLDRAGPNFQFDVLVFDQLTRAYNLQVDKFVLAQALATAGAITYTSGAPVFSGPVPANSFVSKVAAGKSAMASTDGTILPATHLFTQPARWEFFSANAVDSQNRSLITPNYAGAFNASGAGSDANPIAEGDTGYKVLGLPVYEDANIPTPGTGADQAIVAHMPEVWFWEGDLVNRVLPQTNAATLSVLLDVYSYLAAIVRYQKAVQAISGNGMATIVF